MGGALVSGPGAILVRGRGVGADRRRNCRAFVVVARVNE